MITEVKIFDVNSFATLFDSASPVKLTVSDTHKATSFQVESGETRSDHVVVNAVTISMDLMLTGETEDEFKAMQQAYDYHKLVCIQTRVRAYGPMLITSFTHDENPEMADGLSLSLTFTEWRVIEPEYGELPLRKVVKKKQSSTVNSGKVQAQTAAPPPAKKSSVAVKLAGGAAGKPGGK
ncbi:phage baseplate protein [Morganella morganii]|uniref:phage baseplate protein n=1 Tax=Morganella morganii TaxID=582 RepID=UPI003EB7B2E4